MRNKSIESCQTIKTPNSRSQSLDKILLKELQEIKGYIPDIQKHDTIQNYIEKLFYNEEIKSYNKDQDQELKKSNRIHQLKNLNQSIKIKQKQLVQINKKLLQNDRTINPNPNQNNLENNLSISKKQKNKKFNKFIGKNMEERLIITQYYLKRQCSNNIQKINRINQLFTHTRSNLFNIFDQQLKKGFNKLYQKIIQKTQQIIPFNQLYTKQKLQKNAEKLTQVQKISTVKNVSKNDKKQIKAKQQKQRRTNESQSLQQKLKNNDYKKLQLQKRTPKQIYICCCKSNFIFKIQVQFLKHITLKHKQLIDSNFLNSQLFQMSHFPIHYKIIINPLCDRNILEEINHLTEASIDSIYICQCSNQSNAIQSVTCKKEEFLKHIYQKHGKQLKGSSHILQNIKGQKLVQNQNSIFKTKKQKYKLIDNKIAALRVFLINSVTQRNIYVSNPFFPCHSIYQFQQLKLLNLYKTNCGKYYSKPFLANRHLKTCDFCKYIVSSQTVLKIINQNNCINETYVKNWLATFKSKKEGQYIKCGCNNQVYSSLHFLQNHIVKLHNGFNQSFSSHILIQRNEFILNPQYTQKQIQKDILYMQIGFKCGFCHQKIFEQASKYFNHIIYDHNTIHQKNSHFLIGTFQNQQKISLSLNKSNNLNSNLNQKQQNDSMVLTTNILNQQFICFNCNVKFNCEQQFINHSQKADHFNKITNYSHIFVTIDKKQSKKTYSLMRFQPHKDDQNKEYLCIFHNLVLKYKDFVDHARKKHRNKIKGTLFLKNQDQIKNKQIVGQKTD